MTTPSATQSSNVADTNVDTESIITQPAGTVARRVLCTVDFGVVSGTENTGATTTVTGVDWVAADSPLRASVLGRVDHDDGDEDVLLNGVRAVATNRVVGVGFDVIAHAPNGATGVFQVLVEGV